PMVVSALIESISMVKTRESSKAWGGEGRACNGMLAAVRPLSTAFESEFLCGFLLWALVCLVSFLETLFDMILLLRVFILAIDLHDVIACGAIYAARPLVGGGPGY